jgi:predicted transcriptional regulator
MLMSQIEVLRKRKSKGRAMRMKNSKVTEGNGLPGRICARKECVERLET